MRTNMRILGICHLATGATQALEMREASNDGLATLPEMIDRRATDLYSEVQSVVDPFDKAFTELQEAASGFARHDVVIRCSSSDTNFVLRMEEEFPGESRRRGYSKWYAPKKGTPNSSKHGHKKTTGAFGKSRHQH